MIVKYGDREYKTQTIPENLNPIWNWECSFFHCGDQIRFTVKDEDKIHDDYVIN